MEPDDRIPVSKQTHMEQHDCEASSNTWLVSGLIFDLSSRTPSTCCSPQMFRSKEAKQATAADAGDEAELARMGYKQELKSVILLPFVSVAAFRTRVRRY